MSTSRSVAAVGVAVVVVVDDVSRPEEGRRNGDERIRIVVDAVVVSCRRKNGTARQRGGGRGGEDRRGTRVKSNAESETWHGMMHPAHKRAARTAILYTLLIIHMHVGMLFGHVGLSFWVQRASSTRAPTAF